MDEWNGVVAMKETLKQVGLWLDKNGWVKGRTAPYELHHESWFKRFPDEPKCATNTPKPLQIRVKVCNNERYHLPGCSIEIDITAEADHGWFVLNAYSLDSVEEVPGQVERLLKAWRAIAKDEKDGN